MRIRRATAAVFAALLLSPALAACDFTAPSCDTITFTIDGKKKPKTSTKTKHHDDDCD